MEKNQQKHLINFVFAARYYQRFKKQICQPRRELSGNSINVCVGCFWFEGFFSFSFFLFFFICLSPFLPCPPPFSSLYFSYSVMSKPSFFKPLPSFNVYFPYFGWKVDGSTVVILATAAAPTALGHVCFGRCVNGHDTNWAFHVPLTKLLYHAIWWTRCHRALCNVHSATYTA